MEELNRLSTEEFVKSEKMRVTVILDNVRSLNNIGSIFRTSDAFRIEGILLCGITATPPHREIHKTALGATDSVKWEYFEDTEDAVNTMKDRGYYIMAIEQAVGSIPLHLVEYDPKKNTAVIFGNEVNGVQQKIVDSGLSLKEAELRFMIIVEILILEL